MKKLLFMLLCLSALGNAPIYANGNQVELQMGIIDDVPMTPGYGKAPMRKPAIYQEGFTLTLSSSHPEYLINIMEDDEVVFSSVIPEEVATFELPAYLSGEYTIQFVSGRFCFYGLINF